MYCIAHEKIFVQAWDPRREQWEYIPLTKWQRMSDRARARYIIDR